MNRRTLFTLMALTASFGVVVTVAFFPSGSFDLNAVVILSQAQVEPGQLSHAHAFLETNCAACHTPNVGVEAQNCISCHANNQQLLQRQTTAFHADVQSCSGCHIEHNGTDRRPTQMNHSLLATLGVRAFGGSPNDKAQKRIASWLGQHTGRAALPPGHPNANPADATLNCISCHTNQDLHRGLFGTDCIQCHTTGTWTIPEFKHPAPTSTSCVQCHQAPPSHYMEHFRMISMTVAHQPSAKVEQCFSCHQTNNWNDIKSVGFYKHH